MTEAKAEISNHSSQEPAQPLSSPESEEFRLVLEALPDGLMILRAVRDAAGAIADFRIAYTNSAAASSVNRTPEEVLGQHLGQLFPEWRPNGVYDRCVAVAETGISETFETFYDSRLTGWFRNVVVRLNDGIAISFSNITDRKQSEAALRENETRFQAIVRNLPGMLYQYTSHPDGSDAFTYVSAGARELLELEPETILQDSKTVWGLFHPDDLPALRESTAIAVQNSLPWQWEGRLITPSGQLKWIQGKSRPEHTEQGAVWNGLLIDITERKQAEAALRKSEERFQLIAQATNDVMWDCHLLTNQMWWSERLQTVFGYEPAQMGADAVGWAQRVHPDDAARVYASYETSLQGRETIWTDEYRFCRADGSYADVLDRAQIIRDVTGQALRVVGAMADITDRKRVERELQQTLQTLQESEEWARLAIQVGRLGGWRLHLDTNLVEMDERMREIWGEPNDAVLIPLPAVIARMHPDDRDRVTQAVNAAIAPQSSGMYEIEYRIVWNDGTERWVLAKGQAQFAGQGASRRTVDFFGTLLDITDRKHAEEAVRNSAERLSVALAAAKLGDWSWQAATDIVTFSAQAAEMFGIPPGPHMTWTQMQTLLHPDDREQARLQVERAIAEQSDYAIDYRVLHPHGVERWIAAKGRAQYDSSGQVLGMLGVVQDITDRKQAEAEREQLLAREQSANHTLQRFIEHTPVAVVMLDRDMRYLFASQRWMQEYAPGYTNLKGRSHYEVITDVPERWRQIHQRCLAGATERCEEDCYLRADGSALWLHWEILPWYASGGEIGGIIIFAEDITERKQAEHDREKLLEREQMARHAAEQANRIKDEFLAVLSHELRSPLNPILGWAKLLQTRAFDEAATKRALATIERNAKLQTQLIDDLLDVSRILRGKMVLEVSPVNLVTVIDAALETVRLSAEAKSIDIQQIVTGDVEPISGDAGRLQQIVWNLLSNAVKFTPPGGQIEIRLEQVGTDAHLQIKDTGKGIAPEFLPHVFEYFRQEDGTTTRKFGGLGLGLAIVRYLTEQHGGTIQADSPGEGLGATFTVRLPLFNQPRSGAKNRQPRADSALPTSPFPLAELQILVVDDDSDMRELIFTILEQAGAQIKVAASALEALDVLAAFKPDILISDIGMPEMDGYELLRQIRRRSPELSDRLPAIALTAYAGEINQRRAWAAGFHTHVAKPVEPEALVKAIVALVTA